MERGLISGFKVVHKAKFTVVVYSTTSTLSECCLEINLKFPIRPVDRQLYTVCKYYAVSVRAGPCY